MTLLIVDDDKTTVDHLHLNIGWEQFGIGTVYRAYSAGQAKTCLRENPVDMVLCDIEMPGETGLNLLRWMRAQGMETPLIFLTHHAEFPYAQQAIQLGCADYVCKSASLDEIVVSLRRCVDTLRARQSDDELKHIGRQFADLKDGFLNDLLYDLLVSALPSNAESIQRRIDNLHLPIQAETPYRVATFVFSGHQPPFSEFEPGEAELAAENILSELLFAKTSCPYIVTVPAAGRVISHALMPADGDNRAACDAAVQSFKAVFSAAPTVYRPTVAIALPGFKAYHDRLVQADLENVLQRGCVVSLEGLPRMGMPLAAVPDMLDVPALSKLLTAGNKQELLMHLRKFLQRNISTQAGRDLLVQFRTSLFQVLYVGLSGLQISASEVFTPDVVALGNKALDSLQDLIEWMDLAVERAFEAIGKRRENDNLAHKMRDYIENHLAETLNRMVVATAVHVSADHAAKLFKKEFGQSITEYVTAVRLDKAKTLLASTLLPIGRISESVGFESLTYFSTMFKAAVGCSPNQYRQQRQSGAD